MLRTALFLLGLAAALPGQVTTASLLREMTDFRKLAEFPDPPYKTIQWSSYDRRARKPYEKGWFANADGFGGEPVPGFQAVVRKPDKEGVGLYLVGDLRGPGAIVRTWTAMIGGRIRLYLDDAPEPVYDGAAHPFLRNPYKALGGDEKALGGPNGFQQRDAGYFPIPFARRCRILWEGKKKEGHFYAIQLRRYAPGTAVRTFAKEDLLPANKPLLPTCRALVPKPLVPAKPGKAQRLAATLYPGERQTLFETDKGPRALTCLTLKVDSKDIPFGLVDALRETVLRIYFDGSPIPQVETPLGDFFGAAPGVCPYWTLPMQVAPDGTMTCRFVMPFRRSLWLELDNWYNRPVSVTGWVELEEYPWREGSTMHFFARWRVDHGLIGKHRGVACELPWLCARGKGVLVGTAAILMNPTRVPTPWGGWWGEGDEKIWIDGDTFPAIFGTGSEDYFNYSWSVPDLFHHAYCAQPYVTGPGNRGHVTNNRWHILDALPFRENIFFFMELYPHMRTPGMSYARATWFYAFPDLRDDHVPLGPEATKVPHLPKWTPIASHGTRGARFIEGETLHTRPGGGLLLHWACSSGVLRGWWLDRGDTVSLPLDLEKKGRYKFGLVFYHTPRSGRIRVSLDGQWIGRNSMDHNLHSPHLCLLRHLEGDRWLELEAGRHYLTIESLEDDRRVGIDFIWIKRRRGEGGG